ncbi:hypothetical protein [Kangiella shandongensis]|uniref:hypothetical protein n=1 Tax=Kangiella shandongensis TaxID=2763258 RepID=UPI001CC0A228|nr:hypothetical protein [Kangiella shandongensis]
MKTNINKNTKFDVPKRLDRQLHSINQNHLQIRTIVGESFAVMGFAGWLGFFLVGLPVIATIITILPEEIERYQSGLSDSLTLILILICVKVAFILGTIGSSFFYSHQLKRSTPILFDRKDKAIRMIQMGVLYECSWNNVKGVIQNMTSAAGVVITQDTAIVLKMKPVRNINGKPLNRQQQKTANAVIEESFTADGYDGCEMAWEFIREFMENGPEDLDVPKRLYYPLSSKTTRTSISFREAVSYHWPFPPYRDNEPTTLQVIKTILVPVRLAFYIPNVLADGCWHWMMNWGKPKMLLPEQEKATQNAITPDMVFNILGKDKEFMPYPEAKAKLYS